MAVCPAPPAEPAAQGESALAAQSASTPPGGGSNNTPGEPAVSVTAKGSPAEEASPGFSGEGRGNEQAPVPGGGPPAAGAQFQGACSAEAAVVRKVK
ncbi:MAG TPA: hypothetical protein VMF09_06310 [Solirubrobacteraceae bacterium]|nr:hypothetical protein [Solirubrobacteraceae bacterium]